MNRSGQSVGKFLRYFKIPIDQMLIAHDEVAFDPGTIRIKEGGGHNGHNGLKSVFEGLAGERDFVRLRIGVGHPGHQSEMLSYLTGHAMPAEDRQRSEQESDFSDELWKSMIEGDWQRAMWLLHSS